MVSKIEVTNKYFKISLYVYLIFGLLSNLFLDLNFFTIFKLILGGTGILLLILKNRKVKILVQFILILSSLGLLLQTISLIIKVFIGRIIIGNFIFEFILSIVMLIFSIYLYNGSKKHILHPVKEPQQP